MFQEKIDPTELDLLHRVSQKQLIAVEQAHWKEKQTTFMLRNWLIAQEMDQRQLDTALQALVMEIGLMLELQV